MAYNPQSFNVRNCRDLNVLHPLVKEKAELFITKVNHYLNPLGFSAKIISTLRTNAEQAEIYAQGRTKPGKIVTKARPGMSVHNFGCAFDIGIFDSNNKLYTKEAEKYYDLVAKFGKEVGLEWGGDWISVKDRPHYQFTGKYSNSEFLRLANSGTSIDKLLTDK